MIIMIAVVMVARGRRTHGRLTTASDTAGSHWQLDSFSGKRRCRGVRRVGGEQKTRKDGIQQVWAACDVYAVSHLQTACVSDSQLAISRKGIWREEKKQTHTYRTECRVSYAGSAGCLQSAAHMQDSASTVKHIFFMHAFTCATGGNVIK